MFNSLVLAIAVATSFSPHLADKILPPSQTANVDSSESCAVQNSPASVLFAATPETPVAAQFMHLTGMTSVEVTIGADGSITDASVAKTSGNPLLDREALATTHRSTFRPEIKDCVALGGSYIYEVVFNDD